MHTVTSRVSELESKGLIDHTRQRDLYDPIKTPYAKVVMVGVGGIGSATALTLAKIGVPNLVLIDHDIAEPHNVPNQFYAIAHAQNKMYKVVALKKLCEFFGASRVKAIPKKFMYVGNELDGIVVSGLDSMEVRQQLWDNHVKNNPGIEKFICARIGGQDIVIFTIHPCDPDDIKYYEAVGLFSDEEGLELPCTARGVFDVSNMVAGLIGRQVRRILAEEEKIERTIVYNHETLTISGR